MADEDNLTLQINKVVTSVDNNRVEYGNSERGKVLDVTVIGTNHEAFDLTGKKLRFAENKENGKIVVDDQADSESKAPDGAGVFTRNANDDKAGHFKYQYSRYVYQKSGEAWFEIYSDADHVDVTQKFYIDIDNSTLIDTQNDNYISSLTALEATYRTIINQTKQETTNALNSFKDALNKAQTDATNSSNKAKADALAAIKTAQDNATKTLNDLTSQYNGYLAKYNALKAKINADIKTINDNATNEINQIRSNWNSESSQINADYKKQLQSAINDVNAKKNDAIQEAKDNFSAKITDLQKDYNSWKSSTIADLNKSIADIKQNLSQDQTDVKNLNSYLDQVKESIAKAEKSFDKINFEQFVTHDQFEEMKKTKANGLKVTGLGGEYIMAVDQTDGNIDGTAKSQPGLIDAGVLGGAIQVMADAILDKNHYTKQEVDSMKQAVINDLQAKINQKANSTDLETVRQNAQNAMNKATALSNAGFIKAKLSGFKSDAEAAAWAKANHGIAFFDDGN